MATSSEKFRRPLIHADALALFSLGLQITNILGLTRYRMGERGWPPWLRSLLPRWCGPVDVLFALTWIALLASGVALLMAVRQLRRFPGAIQTVPWLCWASLLTAGVCPVMHLVFFPRWFVVYALEFSVSMVVVIAALVTVGVHVRREDFTLRAALGSARSKFECHPCRLSLDGDLLRYEIKEKAAWCLPVKFIRLIGEYTDTSGPLADDYFLCFAVDAAGWWRAPFDSHGAAEVLTGLSDRLQTHLQMGLANSTDYASRILWPADLTGQAMFTFHDRTGRRLWQRIWFSVFPAKSQELSEAARSVLPDGPTVMLRVLMVDYAPDDLYAQVPFNVRLIRQIPDPKGNSHWLGAVDRPLHWNWNGEERRITHVLMTHRWVGQFIQPGVRKIAIELVFVIDDSVLEDRSFDYQRCPHVAIGLVSDVTTGMWYARQG